MKNPIPNSHLSDLKSYKGGESKLSGIDTIFKLSSNENPFGPSKLVIESYNEAINDITVYPDPSNNELIKKLSDFYSLNFERIVCGCGSDELLHLLARAYLSGNDEAIVSENCFAVYPLAIKASGARVVRAREINFETQINSILDLVNNATKMVFLANPNNPTGSIIPYEDILELQKKLPSNILLVLDEAYAEYVKGENYKNYFDLVDNNHNVVVTRTFSKVYGLAGLRVGWAYCPPEVVEILNRLRIPFSVNSSAQRVAIAALDDQNHVTKSVRHNALWLSKMEEELKSLGFSVFPSNCNFLLIEVTSDLGFNANDVYEFLCSEGIIVRQMNEYNLPNYLRITIGTEKANKLIISSLSEFMK